MLGSIRAHDLFGLFYEGCVNICSVFLGLDE
jgi:hypothetical protein